MHIAPRASLEDGLFDVVTIDRRPFLSHARLVPHLYRGTLLDAPGVRFARARQIRAEPSDWAGPITLDLDGETPGTLPATFELRPGALRLKG
jgi:diacylglycerol kinase family enzyme